MSHDASRKVVIVALLANLGIATAKLAGAIATASGSMMAEAIHSFADCGNQGLLLLGAARASKPADASHPLGYGREAYFWAFMVAVVLFTLGGIFSLYEGIEKLRHPHAVEHAGWAIGILGVSLVLEGLSLRTALAGVEEKRAGRGLLAWARQSGDVDLIVVTFEDIAALAGLAIALAAIVLTVATGDARYDACGSIGVAVVLLAVALFVGAQMRRLIVGYTADPSTYATLDRIWNEHGFDVLRAAAVWWGPESILVAIKIRQRRSDGSATELVEAINAGEQAVRAALPEIAWQFVEPDSEG